MTDRTKAMDDLIAQDADLIDKLRDEDSYYRMQEKHWCIDAEELERQRLAAADRIEELDRHLTLSGKVGKALSERIEALEAENERLRGLVQGWHYLAVGPDEMGDYYTHKQLIKASEPYAHPALRALKGTEQ